MGSGQSSVKGIRIEQDDDKCDDQTNLKQKKRKTAEDRSKDKRTDVSPKSNKDKSDPGDKNAEIESVTAQLCESESQRLDLEDRVQALEERIEYLNNQELITETKPCDETLHVKDQYISKLEREKVETETEINKMKQRHRKKVKQLNSKMAESKQETHFEMMELREEIFKLTEENQKLRVSPNDVEPRQSNVVEIAPKLPGGEKMKLILELSEQVTEQGDKINKLEKKVKDRDQIIDELRVKLKNNSEYLKAVDKSGLGSARGDRSNNSARQDKSKESPVKTYWGSASASPSHHSGSKSSIINVSSKTNSEVDNLFGVPVDCLDDEEDSLDNSAGMKKLSELLVGTKSDEAIARESLDALNSDRRESNHNLYQIVEESANSSTGRDSGLGSAGKRETENKTEGDRGNSFMDWKESSALSFESEMSDSDSVTDLRHGSKISSAPPKLQNQGGTKPKKKSRSLRKHVADKKHDRPPRPAMAFVDSDQNDGVTSEDRLLRLHNFPPVLSTVNVS